MSHNDFVAASVAQNRTHIEDEISSYMLPLARMRRSYELGWILVKNRIGRSKYG